MSDKKYCLQCGAELLLDAVPINPDLATSQSVPACHSCHSRIYDVPGNKILELTAQHNELISRLKAACNVCHGEEFKTAVIELIKEYDQQGEGR